MNPFNRLLNSGNANKTVKVGPCTYVLSLEVGTFPIPAEVKASDLWFCVNGTSVSWELWSSLYNRTTGVA